VAIITFQNLTHDSNNDWIGTGFADTLASALGNTSELRLIEISQLNTIIGMLKLKLSEIDDEQTIKKVSKLLGAEFLIMGSYQLENKKILVNYHIVNTDTGITSFSDTIKGSPDEILELEVDLSKNVMEKLKTQFPKLKISKTITKKSQPINYSKGLFCYFKSDIDQSFDCYQKVITEDPGYADAYFGQGTIYLNKKDTNAALEKFNKALDIYRKEKDNFSIGSTYNKIGEAYFIEGNFTEAIDYYMKALDVKKKFDNDFTVSTIYSRLSSIARNLGETGTAIKYAKMSVSYSNKFKDNYSKIESLTNLALLYEETNHIQLATETIEQALQTCKIIKYPLINDINAINLRLLAKLDTK
jgi:tetratricopeptide (TPR) repeat protein